MTIFGIIVIIKQSFGPGRHSHRISQNGYTMDYRPEIRETGEKTHMINQHPARPEPQALRRICMVFLVAALLSAVPTLVTAMPAMALQMVDMSGSVNSVSTPAQEAPQLRPPATPAPTVCATQEEFISRLLRQAGDREPVISLALPYPSAGAAPEGRALLTQAIRGDCGFVRWGIRAVGITTRETKENIVHTYKMAYYSTREQDDRAREMAAALVASWDLREHHTAYDKIAMLRSYISANWRYDETLQNQTAYTALRRQTATCLGFALASQLVLDETGIPSQTVHGRLVSTNELHILLLVQIGELWYTFDPTGLAMDRPDMSHYLKSRYHKDFVPLGEYLTEEFRRARPMQTGDTRLAADSGRG